MYQHISATIERERWKGKLAHTVGKTLFFAAIAPDAVQIYADILMQESAQLAKALAKNGGDEQIIYQALIHHYRRLELDRPKTQNWLMLSVYRKDAHNT